MRQGKVGFDPAIDVDDQLGKFQSRDGGCRRFDLGLSNDLLTVDPVADSWLTTRGSVGDLQNLFQYQKCNETFRQLQSLSKGSSDCKEVVDAFLFRDVDSPFTSVDSAVCNSACFSRVQRALQIASETCSKSWKEEQFNGKYTQVLYKKVYIASTAHLWSKVACHVNLLGQQCVRTIRDYSDLFISCSLFSGAGGLHTRLSAPFTVVNMSSSTPLCPASCADALIKYQHSDGCCSASVSEATAIWADLVSIDGQAQRGPFSMDLGESKNPWTSLGTGLGAKTYGASHRCGRGDAVYPECLTRSAAYCASPSWRAACCNINCLNGGFKKDPGDCYCSCPTDRVGASCGQRSSHLRVFILIPGEDLLTYDAGKQFWTLQTLETLTLIRPDQLQWDSITEVKAGAQRSLQQSAQSRSVEVVVRLLVSSPRDAKRLASMVNNGILSKEIAKHIANISNSKWVPEILKGEYPPIAFDAYGKESCDDVDTPCYFKKDTAVVQSNATILDQEETNVVIVAVAAALGGVAVALLTALAIFLLMRQKEAHGPIFFNPYEVKKKFDLNGLLPTRKKEAARFSNPKIEEDEFGGKGATSSVKFGDVGRKPLSYSIRDKKPRVGFSGSDGLFLSLVSSGYASDTSSGLQGIAVSSDLVFDGATKLSTAVPTRSETERAHAKLITQGRGTLIDSPHMQPARKKDYIPTLQKAKTTFASQFPESITESATMNNADNWDKLSAVERSNFEIETPRARARYRYTPETAGNGLEEAEFQKSQILQRLKMVKKMRESMPTASTLSTPRLFSNLDQDRRDDNLDTLSVYSDRAQDATAASNALRNQASVPRGNKASTSNKRLSPRSSATVASFEAVAEETPRSLDRRMPLVANANPPTAINLVNGIQFSLSHLPPQASPRVEAKLKQRPRGDGAQAKSGALVTLQAKSPPRPQANLGSWERPRAVPLPMLTPLGIDNDDSSSVLGETRATVKFGSFQMLP